MTDYVIRTGEFYVQDQHGSGIRLTTSAELALRMSRPSAVILHTELDRAGHKARIEEAPCSAR